MVLLKSLKLELGIPAPDFNLPGIDGRNYTLDDFAECKVLCIVFMCNHCPYVQAIIDRLIKLRNEFENEGVCFVGINPNDSENYPEDSFEKMPEYAKKWGLNFPYLRDETQEIAKKYKAQCTPDIFVYDKNKKLAYHGRIDDNWQDVDKVKEHELKNALKNLIEGKSVSKEQNPSMGCSIKWK